MPYYRGDYYRGGYYRGGLGSFVKGIAGVVKGAAKGFALGGPIGAIAGARAGLPAKSKSVAVAIRPSTPLDTFLRRGGKLSPAGYAKVAGKSAQPEFGGMFQGGPALHVMRGGYRRMNATNIKALRRAGRRVKAFLKLARRLGALPVSPSGKKLFKAHRRHK